MYTLVIRGAETEVCAEEDGISTFAPFSNPWTHADSAETRRKSRERHVRRETLRRKRNGLSPSFQAARERSVSPPSYRSGRSRYESPAPTTRDRRYESPPPYRSRQAHSSIGSRSPSVRIRVMPRFDHTLDDMSAPTPPESFTPPPGVSAFRTPIVPTPFPTAYHGPFHPQPPLATNGMRPPFRYPPGPMLESPFGPRPFIAPDTTPATPATCVGCRSTLPCVHYSRFLPCHRPLRRWGSMAYHPPCAVCPRTPPPITHSPFFGPYDHLPAPAYFPQGPMPPAPPRLSPLSTPTLSSARFSSAPLSGPHTPTSPHSVAPEMRADSSFGSPQSSQARGRVASPPLRTPGGIDLD
jgi:Wiskott-Aldrich syndrome protein